MLGFWFFLVSWNRKANPEASGGLCHQRRMSWALLLLHALNAYFFWCSSPRVVNSAGNRERFKAVMENENEFRELTSLRQRCFFFFLAGMRLPISQISPFYVKFAPSNFGFDLPLS
jgi:hypothetical protein